MHKVSGWWMVITFQTPMANTARASYPGRSRKLVIALDIGTAFSGGAYALLDPGEIPQIRSVTKRVPPPISGLVTNGDEWEIGTSTVQPLGLQKLPPYYTTIGVAAISVASRTGWISRTTIRF